MTTNTSSSPSAALSNVADGGAVRGVMIAVSVLALALVLGAGYATISSASSDLTKRLADVPQERVQGVSLLDVPKADAPSTNSPSPSADQAASIPGPVSHNTSVVGMHAGAGMPALPAGTIEIEYSKVALPDYQPRTNTTGVVRPNDEIFPPEVLALDSKDIALLGFMIPVQYSTDNLRLSKFVLSPFPSGCCFGRTPGADEWIEVDASSMGGAEYWAYRVVRIAGTLTMGEEYDEYGFLMNLYRIDARQIDLVK